MDDQIVPNQRARREPRAPRADPEPAAAPQAAPAPADRFDNFPNEEIDLVPDEIDVPPQNAQEIAYRLRLELERRGISIAEAVRQIIMGDAAIPDLIRQSLNILSDATLMALIYKGSSGISYYLIRALIMFLKKVGGDAAVEWYYKNYPKPYSGTTDKKQTGQINVENPEKIDESAPKFPGFLDGHVLMIGSTGSGKTTTLKQYLAYGLVKDGKPLFERVKKVFFINNSSTTKSEIDEIRKASCALEGSYAFKDKEWSKNIEFHFFNFEEINAAFAEIETSTDRKLLIIDDFQSRHDIANIIAEKLRFIRKFGTQMVLLAHSYQNEKGIVAIRKSVRYVVICGENLQSFKSILANNYSEATKKAIGEKYLELGSKGPVETAIYRKKVILDTQTGRMYYGTPRFLEFNSKYNLQIENNRDNPIEQSSQKNGEDEVGKRPKFF